MDARDLSVAIVEAMTPSRWQLVVFDVVLVFPWLLGLFQFGELLGHIAVAVSVLARKHWGW